MILHNLKKNYEQCFFARSPSPPNTRPKILMQIYIDPKNVKIYGRKGGIPL